MKIRIIHILVYVYIIVIWETKLIDSTEDVQESEESHTHYNTNIDNSKFVILSKDEKSSSGFVEVDKTKYLLKRDNNNYLYRFKDCCKCSMLKYGDQIVWEHDFNEYGYYYPRDINLKSNELTVEIKNYILYYTLINNKLILTGKTTFEKSTYRDFTIVTLDNDDENNHNINNKNHFDILNYFNGLVMFVFKNNAKCVKVIFDINTVWEYDKDKFGDQYPRSIVYKPDGYTYVDFDNGYYVYKLDSNINSWVLNNDLSQRGSSLLDSSKHPSEITIVTADDPSGTNLKENDIYKYKLYSYFQGLYLYLFNYDVKCHEFKFNNTSLWKYDEGKNSKKFPKSISVDLTNKIFEFEFGEETLRVRLTEFGLVNYTVKNNFEVILDHVDKPGVNSTSEYHPNQNLRSHYSSRSQQSSDGSNEKNSTISDNFKTNEYSMSVSEMTLHSKSIIQLYQNDCLQPFMHLYHLYHENEPEVKEYLVNMLYNKRTNQEIIFYLPQLCQLSLSNGNDHLYRFLLDKALASMNLALQFYWLYHGSINQIPKNDGLNFQASFVLPSTKIEKSEESSNTCLLDRRSFMDTISTDLITNVNSLVNPQIPNSLIHLTDKLSSPVSSVELIGVQTKLGSPLDLETLPTLDYTDDLLLSLQRLMNNKKLNYFNTVTSFVDLCMQNSIMLVKEKKRKLRLPLLKVFVNALNEWMLLRRCAVAAYGKSFAYTGLSLPFDFPNNNNQGYGYKDSDNKGQVFSQILRIVEDETMIFLSKKRAPFLFYVEMANLDEDIESISSNKDNRQFSMRDLYVYSSIVDDLIKHGLINKTQAYSINTPIECIRYVLGMLPKESLERYQKLLDNKANSSCLDSSCEGTATYESSSSGSSISTTNGGDNGESNQLEPVEDTSFIYSLGYTGLNETGTNQQNKTQSVTTDQNLEDPNLNNKSEPFKDNKIIEYGTELNKESTKIKESENLDIKELSSEEVRNIIFPETFEQKKNRIRRNSPYGNLKSWDLCAFVVKGSDDLRQEKIANQLIECFRGIFTKASIPLWLKPIQVLVTGTNSVIMELIHDAYSVDSIKRKFNVSSLATVFDKLFESNIDQARKNFIESHAAYSIITYLFRVKDRHNGNILLDNEGHVIHIDYEFSFSNNPGIINFETSAFKLSSEYLEIIGGKNSDGFIYFKDLMVRGLLEARKHVEEILLLVEMMSTASNIPCFRAGTSYAIKTLKDRFMINESEENCINKIKQIIDSSVNSLSTLQYDAHQRLTNGIK